MTTHSSPTPTLAIDQIPPTSHVPPAPPTSEAVPASEAVPTAEAVRTPLAAPAPIAPAPTVPPAPYVAQAAPAPQVPQPLPFQPQPVSAPSNGVALTAMILGIVGAVVGFWAIIPITGYFSAVFGFPLALAAVICGHIGRGRSKRLGGVGRVQSLVGFLLGYVSIAVMVVASAAWTVFLFVGSV